MTITSTLSVTLPATRKPANIQLLGMGVEPQNYANNLLFNGSEMLWNEGGLAPGRNMMPGNLRWPQGTCADEYEWEKGIGAYSARQQIPSLGSTFLGVMGSDEICNLCAMWGSTLVYTANLYTRSAADMLAHIDYLYSRKMGKRGPREIMVELGNEPYLDIGPATGTTALWFAGQVDTFARALRGKYPDIKIIVPYRSSNDPTGTIWVHRANFSEQMVAKLAQLSTPVDMWAFHNAYLPESYSAAATDADYISAMMAAPLVYAMDQAAAQAAIRAYPIYANSKFCVTEWKGGFDTSADSHRRTVAAAVQDADVMREMINADLAFANHHNLISGNNGVYSYSSSTRYRTPHYWLFSWLRALTVGEYLTVTQTAGSSATISAYASQPGRAGRIPAGTVYPLISGYGTIQDTQVQLILLNKSQTDNCTTTINYSGTSKRHGRMFSLAAVSNPFDLTDAETKYTITQAAVGASNPLTVTLPAMSINYLRFNLGIGAQ